jgi:hypothetical protein
MPRTKAGAPKAGAPKAGAPKAGAPKAGAPKAGAPKAAKPPKAAKSLKAAKPPKATDPRRLVKREDGYLSEDGRFEVSGAAGSWYLADASRPDPLGLPSISGPYRTLAEVRAAVASAD